MSVGLALGGLLPDDAAGLEIDRVEVPVVGADVRAILSATAPFASLSKCANHAFLPVARSSATRPSSGSAGVVRFARRGDEHDLSHHEWRVRVALNADARLPQQARRLDGGRGEPPCRSGPP